MVLVNVKQCRWFEWVKKKKEEKEKEKEKKKKKGTTK